MQSSIEILERQNYLKLQKLCRKSKCKQSTIVKCHKTYSLYCHNIVTLYSYKYLLIKLLLLAFIFNTSCNANVFLRLPRNLLENSSHLQKIDENENIRDRRSLNAEWYSNIKEKAATFGQSKVEIDRVNYYLQRLKEVVNRKHLLQQNNNHKVTILSASTVKNATSINVNFLIIFTFSNKVIIVI